MKRVGLTMQFIPSVSTFGFVFALTACGTAPDDSDPSTSGGTTSSASSGGSSSGSGGSLGQDSGGTPGAGTGGDAGTSSGGGSGGGAELALDAPDNAAELLPWLEAKAYESFVAEPEYHESSGPHGDAVKTFYSPLAMQSLMAGEAILRPGGAVIKELTSGGNLYGWGAYVRGTTADGAASYYFYELIKPNTVYGDAYNSSECTGCHNDEALLLSDPDLVLN